ncbi:hypothetical protein ACP70R_013417 [Stipagrostis hirtigluma subsp. patula]
MVDHWAYNSRKEMGFVCTTNQVSTGYTDSPIQTPCLTTYYGNVPLGGMENHFHKFQHTDGSLATKDWNIYHFFLQQHDVQGLTRVICEKLEDKAKLGKVSNKASHYVLKLFPKTGFGLGLWPLPPEKIKKRRSSFLQTVRPQNGRPFSVRGLLVKIPWKPAEIPTKLNEMARFKPYEQTEVHKVKFIFEGISRKYSDEPTLGMCCIGWVMILRNISIHNPRSLCSSWEDEQLHSSLMDVVAGKFTELPQEILMDIFTLLEVPDLVRVGSVCSSWNSAYTSICTFGWYKWPQTPCLIYTSEFAAQNVAFLYSFAEKRTYKLTLPDPPIHKRYLIGSSHGWLVTADERSEMHLINPITREQISLPSVITIEQVTPIFDETGVICKYRYSRHTAQSVTGPPSTHSLSTLRDTLFHKALLFYDTATGSYIVVLIHNPFGQLSFAKLGDEKWTWLPPYSNFEDCIYKDGLLYAMTLLSEIIAFDISGTVVTTKIILDRKDFYGGERVYMVQAPWGDLLQVRRPEVWIKEAHDGRGHNACTDTATFGGRIWKIEIYKVCIESGKLVQINSLGDHVLFLGHSQSLCLRAKEYPQMKPNHIYFTDDCKSVSLKCKLSCHLVIGILNLETKIMEEIVSPRPWFNCMAPLLILPNPRKMDSANQSCIQLH